MCNMCMLIIVYIRVIVVKGTYGDRVEKLLEIVSSMRIQQSW